MKSPITVLVKRPGEEPHVRHIPNTLEALQELVEGYIEVVAISSSLLIICNEEGCINNMRHNVTLGGEQFFGPILLCGVDGEDFADLPSDRHTIRSAYPELWSVEVEA